MTCSSNNRATDLLNYKQASCSVLTNRILNSFEFLPQFASLIINNKVKGHNETNAIDRVQGFSKLLSQWRQKLDRSERTGSYMYRVNFVHVHNTCVFRASVEL